jgi:hypothetical protein
VARRYAGTGSRQGAKFQGFSWRLGVSRFPVNPEEPEKAIVQAEE